MPVHLLGWATDLDHKTPHVTARAPQSMLQELLNRDDAYLWAILSNGAALRLLRDSTALVGSSYVEFDLEAIFDGELFSDFVLLYLICHESRFAIQGDGGPASCYLEQWRGFAAEQGERALDQLRDGVQQAISILGTGFLSHPDNPQLRTRLDPRNADLKLDDFNRALLRLVYRMLFWFVAEDRGALLQPDPDDAGPDAAARLREARDRYADVLLLRPAAPARPPPPRRPARRPVRGGRSSSSTRSAPRAAFPSWRCPASAASSSPRATTAAPLPARRAARRRPAVQRGAARRGARPVPGDAARRRRLAPRSTSATSAPRNSAASTSRCWS